MCTVGTFALVPDLRVELGERACHQAFFLGSGESRRLFYFLFSLHSLGNLNAVLDLITFFGFFPSLALSCVEDIGHLGMARIYGSVLQTATICLQTHVQGNSISVSILPVGDACWHIPVFHILRR